MRRLLFLPLALAGLALASCGALTSTEVGNNSTLPAPSPSPIANVECPGNAISNATRLDERLALGVEATYTAARTAAELAVDSGRVTGPNATRLRTANRRAYDGLLAVRKAYCAGNQAGYLAAAVSATGAVSALLNAANGGQ